MAENVEKPRILDEEPKTNFEAVGHDRVGDYQADLDIQGTVLEESGPVQTPEGSEDTE